MFFLSEVFIPKFCFNLSPELLQLPNVNYAQPLGAHQDQFMVLNLLFYVFPMLGFPNLWAGGAFKNEHKWDTNQL